ncbi:MAG: CBS domain-containing protein [Pleurocapsa minor HA4230-MV1]|jgi:CBS domain-containing protein|nr:CBS domain-containing protein [Pleurocapsa minor HA4230-MV1]
MRAADIMTTSVFMIDSLATVAEAIALMQDKKVRSLIVEPSEDGAYGIVTETDIIYKVATQDVDPESVMIYQIMTKPCIVVNPDLDLKNVARLFAETGISRAPVIQEHLRGIISVTDLIMKSKISSQSASDSLSLKIQETLLHSRVALDAQTEIDRECEAAWDVVEETQAY